MRNKLSSVAVLLAVLALAGCDSIPFIDNTSDYKGASRGKPLEVPPDLTSISTDDAYSVPGGTTYSAYNQDQSKPEEAEKLLPESSDSVRYERAGSQRWLVVKAPPEKVWPVIREFWTDLGFSVRVESTQTGVMETEWVDAADLTKDAQGNYLDKFQGWLDKLSSLKNRQKFRTRIDRGGEDDVTEIYMSHRSISDVTDDGKERVRTIYGDIENGYKFEGNRTKSQEERAIAEDIDAELLRRLMVKLGVAEKQSRAVIANPVQEKRAALNKAADGQLALALNDQFDRAWRRVGLALDRIGFLVEDRNRSQGLFYVRYSDIEADAPEGEKKGLLDKLKFWGDDDKKEQPKPEPEAKKDDKGMVDKLKFWESKKPEDVAAQYRIKLERAGDGTEVTVVDKNGNRDRSSTANRILSMLYDQLK